MSGEVVQVGDDGRDAWVWCVGCDQMHPFRIAGDEAKWEWNGDLVRPTFSPSLLCMRSVHLCEGEHYPVPCEDYENCSETSHQVGAIVEGVLTWRFPGGMPDEYRAVRGHTQPCTREPAWGGCHSFVRDGRWEYLSDSAHALAGQTVDMVPVEQWPWSWGRP